MKTRHAILAAALLAAGLSAPAAGPARAAEGLDVLFITDDSPSMKRNDPRGDRVRLLKALCDMLAHPGGDRVGVLRLGGASETEAFGVEAYPFTVIPMAPDEKSQTLFHLKAALEAPARGFGRATDFNVVFEKGVFPLLRERPDARPAVVVLVTDGDMSVIEGDRVRDVYRQAAAERPGPVTRAALQEAALRRFRTVVLPLLARSRITVVPVALSRTPAVGSTALAELARLPGGPGEVIELGSDPAAALDRVLRAVLGPLGYVPLGGAASFEVAAGEEAARDMWIPAEARQTRILLLSESEDFSLAFTDVSGSVLGAEEGCSFYGSSEKHRVVSLGPQTIPNRILKVTNRGQAPLRLSVHAFGRFSLAARAHVVNPDKVARAGGAIRLSVSVVSGENRAVVRDKWLVERLVLRVRVVDSSGESLEVVRRLSGAPQALRDVELPLSEDAPGGVYVVQVEPRLVVGSARVPLGSVEDRVRVVAARTEVRVAFASQVGYPDSEVELLGTVEAGKVEAPSLEVTVTPRDGDGPEREVTLTWDPEQRRFRGSLRFPGPGAFEVAPRRTEAMDVLPGVGGGVDIRDRRFSVLGPDGRALEGVVFTPSEDGSYAEQDIEVVANLAPGEEGSFTVLTELRGETGDIAVELERQDGRAVGSEPLRLRGESPRQKLRVRLEAGPGASPSGEIGTFRIQGRIGATSVLLDKGIRAVPRPPKPVSAGEVLKDRRVLVAAIVAGALVLAVLAYWFLLPRFRSEYLVEIDPQSGDAGDGTLLREMPGVGLSPRKASGMPDVKNTVRFELHGVRTSSQRRCLAVPMKPFVQFYVNGKMYMSSTPVQHGDHIRLRGARFVREYVYFEHAVTDEDWQEVLGRIRQEKEAPPAGEPSAEEEAATLPPETVEARAQLETLLSDEEGEAPSPADVPTVETGVLEASEEEAPAEPAAPTARKVVTLEDFFGSEAAGRVRVEEGHAPAPGGGEEEEEEEEAAAAPAEAGGLDDQATVLEDFFGQGEEKAGAGEEPAGDRTEVVAELEGAGDRTEMVSGEAFEGDRTEVVAGDLEVEDEMELFEDEEDGEDEEPSIIIEMPEDFVDMDEVEEARSEETAAASEELPPDLRETQVEESGILGQAFSASEGAESPVELEDADEEVEIIESRTEEFEPVDEEEAPTILETAYESGPDPTLTDEVGPLVVLDEWEYRKRRKKEEERGAEAD